MPQLTKPIGEEFSQTEIHAAALAADIDLETAVTSLDVNDDGTHTYSISSPAQAKPTKE